MEMSSHSGRASAVGWTAYGIRGACVRALGFAPAIRLILPPG